MFGPNVEKLTAKRDFNGLAKALVNKDAEVRDAAAQALVELDDPQAVKPIVEHLASNRDEATIATGASVLRDMGADAVGELTAGLKGPPNDRAPYAALLGRIGEHGLPPLLEASREADPEERAAAAMGLGLIGTAEADARLKELFNTDSELEVRGLAAFAMGSHKRPIALEVLSGGLKSDDAGTRALAAVGLGSLGDPAAADELRRVESQDDDERVRSAATDALAELGTNA